MSVALQLIQFPEQKGKFVSPEKVNVRKGDREKKCTRGDNK